MATSRVQQWDPSDDRQVQLGELTGLEHVLREARGERRSKRPRHHTLHLARDGERRAAGKERKRSEPFWSDA